MTKRGIIDNILTRERKERKMIFYPNDYFKNVTEITYEYLKEKQIKALILDVDNTLIDYNRNLSPEIIKWVKELKKNNIKMFILSNSNLDPTMSPIIAPVILIPT